jgi:predicted alpha/beta hydrolase family esterase
MILLVHGYDGSGPGHWQHWLNEELGALGVPVEFPALPAPTAPERDAWVDALTTLIDAATSPVTVVAHSLGCWAVDHYVARRGSERLRAALLVAPPSPYSLFEPIQSFLPPPQSKAAWRAVAERTLVVGSDNDDYAAPEEFEDLARALDVSFQLQKGAGHINAAAGFGPWPFALQWLRGVGAL